MKKKQLMLPGIGVAAVILIVCVCKLKIIPFLNEKNLVAAQLRKNESMIKDFFSRTEGPPSKGLADVISYRSKILSENYQLGVSRLGLKVQKIFPPEDELPSIYWLDVLDKTHRALLAKAAEAYVSIPAESGFIGCGGDVSGEDVPNLLRKLEATKGMLQFAFDAKVDKVEKLTMSLHETTAYQSLSGIRSEIGFIATLDSFMRFLYALQNAPGIFIVDKVSIMANKNLLTTDMIIWNYYIEVSDIEDSNSR